MKSWNLLKLTFPPVKYEKLNLKFDKSVYVIKGENGSGKTTFFRALTKNIEYNGSILIDGKNINKLSHEQIAKDYISYVKQEDNLLDELTVEENILLYIKSLDEVNYLICDFKLQNLLEQKVKTLSGGERKKIQLVIGNVNFNLDSFHKVNALYAAIFTKRYSTGDI